MKRSPLKRTKGLPFKSPKQKQRDRDWAHATKLRREYVEDQCEGQISYLCRGEGDHGHHVIRDRTLNTFHNCRWVCWHCHSYIHNHPAWSYAHGFLDRSASSRGTQFVPRLVGSPPGPTPSPAGGVFDQEEC